MTNKELSKSIWSVIDTDLSFEEWHKIHFSSCIEEAASLAINCELEDGSFIDIPATITRDKKLHTFDIEKNNFIEYYGEEGYFKRFTTLANICDDLVNYAAGSGKSEFYNDAQSELFGLFDSEWWKLDCDAEGANPEQEKEQDELIKEYAQKIFEAM